MTSSSAPESEAAVVAAEPVPKRRRKPAGTKRRRRVAPVDVAALPRPDVRIILPSGRPITAGVEHAGVDAAGRHRWRVVPPAMYRRLPPGCDVEVVRMRGPYVVEFAS